MLRRLSFVKRRDLVAKIKAAAATAGLSWEVDREGGNHTVFSLDGLRIPIPSHSNIDEDLSRLILKECQPKLGERWWE